MTFTPEQKQHIDVLIAGRLARDRRSRDGEMQALVDERDRLACELATAHADIARLTAENVALRDKLNTVWPPWGDRIRRWITLNHGGQQ